MPPKKRANSKADHNKASSKKSKKVNNKEDDDSHGSESDSQLVEQNSKTGQEKKINKNSNKSDEESQSQSKSKKERHNELNSLKKDKLIEKIIKLEDDLEDAIKTKENCLVRLNIGIHKIAFEIYTLHFLKFLLVQI